MGVWIKFIGGAKIGQSQLNVIVTRMKFAEFMGKNQEHERPAYELMLIENQTPDEKEPSTYVVTPKERKDEALFNKSRYGTKIDLWDSSIFTVHSKYKGQSGPEMKAAAEQFLQQLQKKDVQDKLMKGSELYNTYAKDIIKLEKDLDAAYAEEVKDGDQITKLTAEIADLQAKQEKLVEGARALIGR